MLRHHLAVLAHRHAGARLDDAGQLRLEMRRPQTEPGRRLARRTTCRVRCAAATCDTLRIDDRHVAGRVDAAPRCRSRSVPSRSSSRCTIAVSRLVPQARCRSNAGVSGARPLSSTHSRVRLKSCECLSTAPAPTSPRRSPRRLVAIDQRLQRRREHVLIARLRHTRPSSARMECARRRRWRRVVRMDPTSMTTPNETSGSGSMPVDPAR